MAEELFVYVVMIVAAGVLSLLLSLFSYVKLRNAPGGSQYMVVTLLSAVFSFSYAFELMSTTLKEIKFWLGIEYLVMPFLPGFILFMCVEYIGRKIKRPFLYVLFGIPLVTVFTHHTNELHHLYYASVGLRKDTPFPVVDFEYGPFFYVHALYLFLCLSISIVILLLQLRKSLLRFRLQILTMVAGLLMPIVANHFYLNDLSPYGIDLGPVSMSISFILHGLALFSFQMFHVAPIAREKVFESMLEGVVVLNQHGEIIDYNKAMLEVIPMLNSFSIGRQIEKILSEDQKLAALIRRGEECDYERIEENRNTYYQVRFSPVLKNASNIGTIITFVNITERVEMQKKLHQLASYDGLTNIYNRTFFMHQSVNKLKFIKQKGGYASLIMFDIDHFKQINDTYGHEAGDIVLANVAQLAKSSLEPQDIIGRYGGEEFIILLPGKNVKEASELANIIRISIAESLAHIHGQTIYVTSSFGISPVLLAQSDQKEAIKLAIRKADHALYTAKNNGRNNVQSF
ncbi:histidine kinase N-terminal 7TM domain-containing protein [Lysinibacillus odysseyi]|uniref:Diguanylate cyclase n=1 Tax=Lysinibacillus odysseyi 34hs-1 = NBRC 100172 TaxID=1220589 RepID=A0A0A3IRV6_9BACI|nr:histidine kinase N-terminal 7TM domain-containing protein [Lysinibacillus odysseyi]KGR86185.1 diguanylate cyclase [Lysinibacillus odysseyi 34hs-1 = NBRC 100172]